MVLGKGATRLLRGWLGWVAPNPDDPLYQLLDSSQWAIGPISRRSIVAVVRKRVEDVGVTGTFGIDSLRIGAA